MSSSFAVAQPRHIPTSSHIEIVTSRHQRKARPRAVYAVVTMMSLFVIFLAQLLLSIVVSEGAFQIDGLQQEQKELLRTQDALSEKLNLLDSTQNLANQAAHLGMAPNPAPLTLDIQTGAVYASPGTADPAGCGGNCDLVSNSLLAAIPLIERTASASGHAIASQPSEQIATVAPLILPAPITRQ